MGSDEPPPSLPWHANPATGMVIGLTFLFFCMVGPVALLVPLIAWLVSRQRSTRPRSVELPTPGDVSPLSAPAIPPRSRRRRKS